MISFSRLAQGFVIAILLGAVCACNNSKDIPVIDVFSDSNDTIEVRASEINESVEYLQLNFPIEMKGAGNNPQIVIVGDKVIAYLIPYMGRVFIFNRKGEFEHAFDISAEKAITNKKSSQVKLDMSPDEHKIVFELKGNLYVYNINGYLLGTCEVPFIKNDFFFLDSKKIAVLRSRSRMESDGNLIFIYNEKLELCDSLFWAKTPGPMPDNNRRRSYMSKDYLFKSNNNLYLKVIDNDTLFKILPDLTTNGELVINLGDHRPPLKWHESRTSGNNSSNITSFFESENYMILEIDGPLDEEIGDRKYSTILVNKNNGEYFLTKRNTTNPNLDSYYYRFIDDIDGFDNRCLYSFNKYQTLMLDPTRSRNYLESDTSIIPKIKDQQYLNELSSILDKSNDTSVIFRITSFTSNKKRQSRNIKFKPQNPIYGNMIKPVKTNHEWPEANSLSGLTYDPTDDSFWLVKMKFNGADFIEHRDRNGMVIPGSFVTDRNIDVEAITVSTFDSTLWFSDTRPGKSIMHFDRNGNDLGDGFDLSELTGIYAMAFDNSDSTLWLMESNKNLLWNYSTKGTRIGDSVNLFKIGCDEIRGMCYDDRDSTLWLLNSSPHKMFHIDKEGNLLSGSFYFNPFLGLPDGVALDYKNYEFWVGDWSSQRNY